MPAGAINITPVITGRITGTGKQGSVGEDFNLPATSPFLQLVGGTGAGQFDTYFEDTRTLAASATENLDLSGVLIDRFGDTVTFGHVKAIMITADPANTNDVVVGAGTNPFVGPLGGTTPTIAISPGECFLITKGNSAKSQVGWPVVNATGDILKVANGAGTTGVNYSIFIVGTST